MKCIWIISSTDLRPLSVMNDRTKYSTIDCSKTFSRLWLSMIQRSAKTCSCVLSVYGSVPHITAHHHTTPHNTTHHPTPWQQHCRTLCSCRTAQWGVSPAGCRPSGVSPQPPHSPLFRHRFATVFSLGPLEALGLPSSSDNYIRRAF